MKSLVSKKPWKQCLSYGCGKLIREGGYCSKHKDERNQESRRFYQSSSGKKVRAYMLARDSNLCQQCLKDKKFTQADVCDTTTSKPSQNTSKPNDNLGLVDYMNSKKMDSSMTNRKKLAKQYGIKNYKGTASQNTTLLSKIKGDKPSASTASTAKANLKVDGYLGIQSIKAIQRYFGTVVDGKSKLSKPSLVIKELQRRLNKGKL